VIDFYIKRHYAHSKTCVLTNTEVHFVTFSNKAHSGVSFSHSFSAYHQLFFVQPRGCVIPLLVGGNESIPNAKD